MTDYFPCAGDAITTDDLKLPKAIDFASCAQVAEFVRLLECRSIKDVAEVVVVEVDIELGQKVINDIRESERIGVYFFIGDIHLPEVLALRQDFPLVPHVNQRFDEFPRSLCLYDKGYEELKLDWTAIAFLERIREWLALTAKGKLHRDDQPLEPILLFTEGDIILPSDIDNEPFLIVCPTEISDHHVTLVAKKMLPDQKVNEFSYVALQISTDPQTHGIIRSTPRTLQDLHILLESANTNLLQFIESKFDQLKENGNFEKLKKAKLIIIVKLPKKRTTQGDIESVEKRAFLTVQDDVRSIGIKLEKWVPTPEGNDLGINLFRKKDKNGSDIQVGVLNPMSEFTPEIGQILNGVTSETDKRISFFGVGALGSQVVMNLARKGYSKFKLIDNDILFPHNLARHALFGGLVGKQKVGGMTFIINDLHNKSDSAKGFFIDLIRGGRDSEEYKSVVSEIADADYFIDATTSIAMSRFLATQIESPARRIALFLNPTGSSLILLAEDTKRAITLDQLEMQYYRFLTSQVDLHNHLSNAKGSLRYAGTCRDISSRLPQDAIAFHSAIASNALEKVMANENAQIQIWENSFDDYKLKYFEATPTTVTVVKQNEWTLCIDSDFMKKIHEERIKDLPNETGGVLVGAYDMSRKVVYLVDSILSPDDSKKWPTVYIRGHKYLEKNMDRIREITQEHLTYVGEWHSHPAGCSCIPSLDDRKAFLWQAEEMEKSGYPAIMLIAGDNNNYAFYIKEI